MEILFEGIASFNCNPLWSFIGVILAKPFLDGGAVVIHVLDAHRKLLVRLRAAIPLVVGLDRAFNLHAKG